MRTAQRSWWLGLVAVATLAGCPTPRPVITNDDAFRPDTGTAMMVDMGPPRDTNPPDAFGVRVDMGGMPGMCSYGGGCDLTSTSAANCPDVMGVRQACYPGMTASECQPAGSVGAGGDCMTGRCDTGLVCLTTNICTPVCCSNADCPIGDMCNPLTVGGAMLPNNVGVCKHPTVCTPIPNSCGAGQQCYLTAMDGSTDCLGTGTATEGMTCGGAAGCVAGLGCYGTMAGGATCTRFCHLGSTTDCAMGQTCNASGLGSDMFGLCQAG